MEERTFDEKIWELIKPVPERGILKATNTPPKMKQKRRIQFDPLALLLDAALEGETDLVKHCAQKVNTRFSCFLILSSHHHN